MAMETTTDIEPGVEFNNSDMAAHAVVGGVVGGVAAITLDIQYGLMIARTFEASDDESQAQSVEAEANSLRYAKAYVGERGDLELEEAAISKEELAATIREGKPNIFFPYSAWAEVGSFALAGALIGTGLTMRAKNRYRRSKGPKSIPKKESSTE